MWTIIIGKLDVKVKICVKLTIQHTCRCEVNNTPKVIIIPDVNEYVAGWLGVESSLSIRDCEWQHKGIVMCALCALQRTESSKRYQRRMVQRIFHALYVKDRPIRYSCRMTTVNDKFFARVTW